MRGAGASRLRKVLVVTQFSIAIILMIATLVVLKQTQYARTLHPGYAKDNNNNQTITLVNKKFDIKMTWNQNLATYTTNKRI